MRTILLTFGLIFLVRVGFGQTMRSLKELVSVPDSGWVALQREVAAAKNKVEVLPRDSGVAGEALYHTQVTTRSLMGAIVYRTGGILIDGGWIRILGSASERLPRSLPDWNKGKTFQDFGDKPAFYLVGDDAIGGFFALNGGGLGKDVGAVYYLAPDNLKWASLWESYGAWVDFCVAGDLVKFYGDYRWKGWRKDLDTLGGGRIFYIIPPLWSKEGKDINRDWHRAVSADELYSHTMLMRRKVGVD